MRQARNAPHGEVAEEAEHPARDRTASASPTEVRNREETLNTTRAWRIAPDGAAPRDA
jgi:hypothetical protein